MAIVLLLVCCLLAVNASDPKVEDKVARVPSLLGYRAVDIARAMQNEYHSLFPSRIIDPNELVDDSFPPPVYGKLEFPGSHFDEVEDEDVDNDADGDDYEVKDTKVKIPEPKYTPPPVKVDNVRPEKKIKIATGKDDLPRRRPMRRKLIRTKQPRKMKEEAEYKIPDFKTQNYYEFAYPLDNDYGKELLKKNIARYAKKQFSEQLGQEDGNQYNQHFKYQMDFHEKEPPKQTKKISKPEEKRMKTRYSISEEYEEMDSRKHDKPVTHTYSYQSKEAPKNFYNENQPLYQTAPETLGKYRLGTKDEVHGYTDDVEQPDSSYQTNEKLSESLSPEIKPNVKALASNYRNAVNEYTRPVGDYAANYQQAHHEPSGYGSQFKFDANRLYQPTFYDPVNLHQPYNRYF